MSYDRPVIVSKQSGVSEVLRNALKVDFWDVDKMASQIVALLGASGLSEIDFEQCSTLFSGELLALCETARAHEETWVNFKLFGFLGLTLVFMLAQGFYLSRFMEAETPNPED